MVGQIVDKFVAELEDQLTPKRVTLELTTAAREWLAAHGYDHRFGARPMRRLIDREIRRRLADEILFGDLSQGGSATIGVEDDALSFELEGRKGAAERKARKPAEVVP